ncbi:MAG: uroporphyrinogen-III synthase [Flavobacteriales bacterium]|nr:uroporphyrinogen-III synthase [Flavobacteriales bacterium]
MGTQHLGRHGRRGPDQVHYSLLLRRRSNALAACDPRSSAPDPPDSEPLSRSALKIKTILVSQPAPTDEKSPYHELAKKFNLKIDFRPFIKVESVAGQDFRQERINILDHSAIVLTSRNAVDHFFRMCKELRLTVPETMKYFCVSESVAYYVQKYIVYRKRKVFIGKQSFGDLVDVIKKHKDETYLVPCSDIQKQEIPEMLDKAGVKYTNAVFYRTVASDLSDIKELGYDMLVFFSPGGIESLKKNFPKFKQNGVFIAAFGPTTAKAVRDNGLRLDLEAPLPEAPSMTGAMELFIKREAKKK